MTAVQTNRGTKDKPKYKSGKPVRRRGRSGRGFWIVGALVVVVGVAAVVAFGGGSKSTVKDQLAGSALLAKVTSVPTKVSDQVGIGTAATTPKAITAPLLKVSGKPHILYLGAEYCPYCAAERWPMVIALSRFGTFSGLKLTHSSGTDLLPNTQTFSFHGSTYRSTWISFSGVEMQSNVRNGDGYATLDSPTAEEMRILNTYDRPPYVGASGSGGGIPFIDFGGRFVVSGATYDAGVLQGKSHDQIAAALSDPTSAVSQGAIGAANSFTAAICSLTGDQPSGVCSGPTIQSIERTMH